jgi:hypothetical protein
MGAPHCNLLGVFKIPPLNIIPICYHTYITIYPVIIRHHTCSSSAGAAACSSSAGGAACAASSGSASKNSATSIRINVHVHESKSLSTAAASQRSCSGRYVPSSRSFRRGKPTVLGKLTDPNIGCQLLEMKISNCDVIGAPEVTLNHQ